MRKHEIVALGLERCQHCNAPAGKPCITPSYMTRMPHSGRPSGRARMAGKILTESLVDGPAIEFKKGTPLRRLGAKGGAE